MKERPILMSAPMVRAILDGRKTQTRRAVKPHHRVHPLPGPYGQPGDRLWVRESFALSESAPRKDGETHPVVLYAADDAAIGYELKCRPSIHMPRALCRIVLELTAVRVERLQDISEDDAIAEGIEPSDNGDAKLEAAFNVAAYFTLWDAINGRGAAERNPWVWVLAFRRIEPPLAQVVTSRTSLNPAAAWPFPKGPMP